jgi:uncharacterized protein YbjQ (UPF0145 family)
MANYPPGAQQQQSPQMTLADLPQHARERIERTRGAQGQRFFTSDLSVNEFLLVREAGFEPAGMVMGSSMYHVGYQRGAWSQNQELVVLTQAMYQARELAMARMEEEAEALGSDGVIGVRLKVKRHTWGEDLIEFLAIGTAVWGRDGHGSRTPGNKPFTSDLSGQEFWTLREAGFRPVSLVMGNCVYHVAHQTLGGWFKTVGQNAEMTNFTQGLYDARELAMERMQYEAQMDGAIGVVGADIHESSYGWDTHVIEYFAVGTSVLPIAGHAAPPRPALVMSVND